MASKNRQIAYLFTEVGDLSTDDLGGKGFGLVQMTKAGFPVPSGFVIPTGVCRAYLQEGRLPKRLDWQLRRAVTLVELATGRRFGGSTKPLLLSVRSGAKVSMPGMMDTVLNLGFNGVTREGLTRETLDEQFAFDTQRRFEEAFRVTVLGNPDAPIPHDPWEQLRLAIETVCRSWGSERAIAYRKVHNIPDNLGTAVVVQAMVFGNASGLSGTGVVFSRNVKTGEPGLYGEFLSNGQGEDVVAGTKTPKPIAALALANPRLYGELAQFVDQLERCHGDVVDVEFTVERGRLYLLQVRVAKRTPVAAVCIAVDMVREGRWTEKDAVTKVTGEQLALLEKPRFDPEAFYTAAADRLLAKGLSASGGAAVGKAVFSSERARELADAGYPVILVREDTSPDDFPGMLAAAAIVTATGGETSHAAVVARGLGRPAVVGASDLTIGARLRTENGMVVEEGETISVDGTTGFVIRGEVPLQKSPLDEKSSVFLSWRETYRPRPKINASVVNERWSVNLLLNDFYLSGALLRALEGTELQAEAHAVYSRAERITVEVFAAYLLIAVAGESRHAWHKMLESSRDKFSDELLRLKEDFRVERLQERRDAQMGVFWLLDNRPKKTLDFLELATVLFRDGRWDSSFGGERWAAIALTLSDYLRGQIPPALFVDRVFDLRHNGGKLFDKHPMVRGKTNEERLRRQLDVKRSSQGAAELKKNLYKDGFFSDDVLRVYEKWEGHEP